MKQFHFVARTSAGDLIRGIKTAVTAEDAARSLAVAGHFPISVELEKQSFAETVRRIGQISITPLSDSERIMFCRQMASLLKAGLPVSTALECIARSTSTPQLKRLTLAVAQDVATGQELASALQRNKELLSPASIAIVHAAEQVGRLDMAFADIFTQLDREQTTRRDVWKALRYPLVVMAALMAAMLVVNIFAVPAFQKVFHQLGADLPWATELLIACSSFVNKYGVAFAAALVLFFCVANLVIRLPRGEFVWGWTKMNVPWFSRIVNYCMMSRFCNALGMMTNSGIPLVRALGVSADVAGNSYFKQRMASLQGYLKGGDSLHSAAQRSGLFTPAVLEILAIGESTGTLSDLLSQIGEYYEDEAKHQAQQLSALVQPALLCVLAAVVAVFGLGVYLPMWSMLSSYF
jgi:MSHA biogenesis protein MshG